MKDSTKGFLIAFVLQVCRQIISKIKGAKSDGK